MYIDDFFFKQMKDSVLLVKVNWYVLCTTASKQCRRMFKHFKIVFVLFL